MDYRTQITRIRSQQRREAKKRSAAENGAHDNTGINQYISDFENLTHELEDYSTGEEEAGGKKTGKLGKADGKSKKLADQANKSGKMKGVKTTF